MHLKVIFTLQILNFNSVLMNINQDDEKKKFSTYCMDVQNVIRQYFGAPPLVWDDVLAERAQALALYLSGSQKKHTRRSLRKHYKYGDNIYATDDPENIDNICFLAAVAWMKEFESASDQGRLRQLVQKKGQKVGIGDAGRANQKYFLVASYFPPELWLKKRQKIRYKRISLRCIWQITSKNGTDKSKRARQNKERLLRQFRTKKSTFYYNGTEPCHYLPGTSNRTERKTYRDEDTSVNRDALMQNIREMESRVISENKLKKKTRMAKYGTKSGLSNAAEAKKEIQEDSRQSPDDQKTLSQGGVKTALEHPSKIILVPVPEPTTQLSQSQVLTSTPAKTVPPAQTSPPTL